MDKLKLYAAPLVGLVLIVVWFFFIRPALDESEAPSDVVQEKKEIPGAPDPSKSEEERRKVPDDPAKRVQ